MSSSAAEDREAAAPEDQDAVREEEEDNRSDEVLVDHEARSGVSKRTLWLRWGIVAGVAALLLVIIVVAVCLNQRDAGPESPGKTVHGIRHDCHPDRPDARSADACRSRGCTWDPVSDADVPDCFFPADYVNYHVDTVSRLTDSHLLIHLNKSSRPSGFDDDVTHVAVEVTGAGRDVVRIRVYDYEHSRWQVPLPHLRLEAGASDEVPRYMVSADRESSLLEISRTATGHSLFRTNLTQLIFSDHFLSLRSNVSSDSLYGFGERQAPHLKSLAARGGGGNARATYVFMNHDGVEGVSSYGSHPFYLMYEEEGGSEAHGLLLLNSNPSDVVFTKEPALTFRSTGGILDFLLFLGPDARSVLQQKARVTALPLMPPYWSLGFHLSRWGYHNVSHASHTLQRNAAAGVPVDVLWLDIDYMDNFEDFTYDRVAFEGLPQFAEQLHSTGRRLVPILDPAIEFRVNQTIKELFVTDADGELLVTRVWNPRSIIPDFTNHKTAVWWGLGIKELYDQFPFDGLWIDMNEPATTAAFGSEKGCSNSSLDRPAFNPRHPDPLEHRTVCMSAWHQGIQRPHLDVHNLFSLFQAEATFAALKMLQPTKRPFILSRASTTGQQALTAHWTGDVSSSWEHMRASVANILDLSLFGFSLVGADVCGFNGETTDELCSRWSSLGAFYPFARNHNSNSSADQDPASLGTNVVEAARKALDTRYSLLPYLYSLTWHSHRTGDPVLRSLRLNFPRDNATLALEEQFMWGSGLLVSPVLRPSVNQVDAYFPAGRWFQYPSGRLLHEGSDGALLTLDVDLTDISVALRGGVVFPTIPSVNRTTADHAILPFTILAVLDERERASGDLYWDDGESADAPDDSSKHSYLRFKVRDNELTVRVEASGFKARNAVSEVTVWGVSEVVESVTLTAGAGLTTRVRHTYVNGRLRAFLPNGTPLLQDFKVSWSSVRGKREASRDPQE